MELPSRARGDILLPPGEMTLSTRVWMLLHTGVESHLAGVGLLLVALYGLAGLAVLRSLGRSARDGPGSGSGSGPVHGHG